MSKNYTINNLNYAQDDNDAEDRYTDFRSIDPFPNIESALLNTADIADYISATGMICPFNPFNLKSASYEMDLGGQVLYWDGDKPEYIENLLEGEKLILKRNSITYLTVGARFRVPDYIALRFNLQIEHVHRGLLLGTGPLVNPGFNGNLMIPIHNLTENDYEIQEGQSLIGVEFTKISKNQYWQNSDHGCFLIRHEGKYQPNLMKKNNKTFLDYLKSSLPVGVSVRSSLSSTLSDMKDEVGNSQTTLKKIRNIASIVSAISFFAIIALIFTTWSITSDANKYVSDAEKNHYNLQNVVDEINKDLLKLHAELNESKITLTDLNNSINTISNIIEKEIMNKLKTEVSVIDQKLKKINGKVEKMVSKPK